MSKKKVSISVIIIGLILVMFGCVLILNNDDETVNGKDDGGDELPIDTGYSESLGVDSDLVQGLYYKTKSLWYGELEERNYYYYKNDKLLVSDFDLNYVYNIVFYRLERMGMFNESRVVSEEIVKSEFKEIFGDNVTYEVLNSFVYGCTSVNYDMATRAYKLLMTDGCVGLMMLESKVVEAYKFETKIEIIEKVLFKKNGTEYYYDVEMTSPATGVTLDDNIMKYVYTFNYDSNSREYYFYSVERVK